MGYILRNPLTAITINNPPNQHLKESLTPVDMFILPLTQG